MNKYIRNKIPSREQIKASKYLKFLGQYLDDANLWHFNRKSVAGGVAVGLFCAWIPLPFQMVFATIFAVYFSVNLPLPIALVWITNPFTMPPLYYFAYWLGAKTLNSPLQAIEFQLSFSWLLGVLGQIWQPFLFGCLIIGSGTAIIGYLLIKLTWRYHVVIRWRRRQRVANDF